MRINQNHIINASLNHNNLHQNHRPEAYSSFENDPKEEKQVLSEKQDGAVIRRASEGTPTAEIPLYSGENFEL